MWAERRRIVEMWQRGEAAALATLVNVEGSSYRKVGAKLLISRNGSYTGSISGGCLEAEIVRKAPWMVRDGATVVRYSTLFDDTAEVPYGLGCGGTVEVLMEPAGTPEFGELLRAMAASLRGDVSTVATVLPRDGAPLVRFTVGAEDGQGQPLGGIRGGEAVGIFQDHFEPPPRLVLFGAGDDAQPAVRLASLLGWRVAVVDSRVQWAKAARFPEAEAVWATEEVEALAISPADAVVLMTHSYEQDRAWLTQVLPRQPRYVGLLGSRHRSALLVAEAAQALEWDLERACDRLFSPVGLDLGGDGAEAIALSIVAEVQASLQGKLAHSRRMTTATVQEQIALGGASRYLQTQCTL